jgi:hypothetical protein
MGEPWCPGLAARFLRVLDRLHHALPQEPDPGTAIALALEELQAVNPTTPLSLALRFSAFTMREIGLVIAPLDPRHKSEALFNRIGMQGQHDLE